MTIRRLHAYFSLLVAPSVLFFALTGGVQLFSLHEAHGNYQPPALVEKLSSVHKDQEFKLGHHAPPPHGNSAEPASAPPNAMASAHDEASQGSEEKNLALKWYFLVVSALLTISILFGIWMALTQIRRRTLAVTLLLIGTVVPMSLLLL